MILVKRSWKLLLIICLTITISVLAMDKGDPNDDGEINVVDARICLQHALGIINLPGEQKEACDIALPCGVIDREDADLIAEVSIGLKDESAVNCLSGVDIEKTPDDQEVKCGGTATFTITVINNSQVDLTDVTVIDQEAPDCERDVGDLNAGESTSYQCSVDNVREGFTNSATVSGTTPVGAQVDDTDEASVSVACIDIEKTPDSQQIPSGGTANFTIAVENTGDVDLSNVAVTDQESSDCENDIGYLPADDKFSYTCSKANVTQDFTNTAIATGTSPVGNVVNDTDAATVLVEPDCVTDDFEDGSLSEWTHDILCTWATYSFDHGITEDSGNKVAFIKGGIDNGGGGGQVLVREDLTGTDMSVTAQIKFVENPDHVNYYGAGPTVNGGLVARYQSTGKGYTTQLHYQIYDGVVSLTLSRMDGTAPGPNYEYQTLKTTLAGPITLTNFNPTQWNRIELEVRGEQIKAKVNGQVLLETTDNTYSQGSPGVGVHGSDGGGWEYYDNFQVCQ